MRPSILKKSAIVLLSLGIVALTPQLLGDDRQLLRENGGEPFLFILLDTSLSMTLTTRDDWVHANGNDPRSRIFQAKEALYDVLKDVPGVRFGFATMNQDRLRVPSKHFLYFPARSAANVAAIANLGIDYPRPMDFQQINDTIDRHIANPASDNPLTDPWPGDMLTFGKGFFGGATLTPPAGAPGSCDDPIDLGTQEGRETANRFALFGVESFKPGEIWVEAGTPKRAHRISYENVQAALDPSLRTNFLGKASFFVNVTVEQQTGGDCANPTFAAPKTEQITFRLWRDFLMADNVSGTVDFFGGGGNAEISEGFWDFTDTQASYSCGDSKPFSGGGWEGNYDTGRPLATDPAFEESQTGYDAASVDTHCAPTGDPLMPQDCDLLQNPTTFESSPDRRELDRGDVLPFHWNFDNQQAMLRRLNPRHGTGRPPQFGGAPFFRHTPDPTGRLQPWDPSEIPIVAAGPSPVSDMILDFRCWYLGPNNKCGRGNIDDIYTIGFMDLLEINDPGGFLCRQPFLIVITDLDSNCPGNSPVAQVAGMNSQTGGGASGVSSWVLNMGTINATGFANAGKGEEIRVDSRQRLREELQNIVGIIQESPRSFASAAVPSVQADVEDKIYVTQFVPRQLSPVWEGHVDAFLKPLPTAPVDPNDPTGDQAPDRTHENHLWDAGEVLVELAPNLSSSTQTIFSRGDLKIGISLDPGDPENGVLPSGDRRILYAVSDTDPGNDADGDGFPDNDVDLRVPRLRQILGTFDGNPPSMPRPAAGGGQLSLNHLRKDLWRGLGVVDDTFQFNAGALGGNPPISQVEMQHPTEAQEAHRVFKGLYGEKVVEILEDGVGTGTFVNYVLGDIFHATPQVIGSPANGRFLARPLEFPGYKEFFEEQSRRRRVLFVASDDGQLHAFDAGRFIGDLDTGSFNNGSGVELFSYVPRALLPTVAISSLADLTVINDHQWGIDATPAAGDVFIDVAHDGVESLGNGPDRDERQWRTVIIGGLRRGGRSLYAIDVTKPDEMELIPETDANGNPVTDANGNVIPIGFVPKIAADASKVLPDCFQSTGGTARGDCDQGAVNYPEILWEFTDPELGQTWSSPDIGPVRVIENISGADTVVARFVAVFGGGMDPNGQLNGVSAGNYLYMVDVESGELLWKERVQGAVPAAPATVDTDQDGFLDRMYVGTTEGHMYRVNLTQPLRLTENRATCAAVDPVTLEKGPDSPICILPPAEDCVGSSCQWEPYEIFDTISSETDSLGVAVQVRKPIFFRPSVIFSSRLGRFALAFGTGNRDNLWGREAAGGNRFYLFVDDSDLVANPLTDLPFLQTDFVEVTSEASGAGPVGSNTDLLQGRPDGERGWYIKLGVIPARDAGRDVRSEKVISPPTAIAGVNVFTTFVPEVLSETVGNGNNATVTCARRGISRVFTQFTSNGDPVPVPDPNDPDAPLTLCENPPCDRTPNEASTLVSEPFIEQADAPCTGTEGMAELLKERLFPPTCRFASYRWNLSSMLANTGVQCMAQIPVCIIEKNWTDDPDAQ